MDKKLIELILENNKKLRCCIDEGIEPASNGIEVRTDNRKEKELNGILKPLNEAMMDKITTQFDIAHDALIKIQKYLD